MYQQKDPEAARERLLERHRDINVDSGWWAGTYDVVAEELKAKGIVTTPNQMSFSGFASQGDGACFTGEIKIVEFLAAHPQLGEKFPAHKFWIERASDDMRYTLKNGRSSHYCHSGTVHLDAETFIYQQPDQHDCDVMRSLLQIWAEQFNTEADGFEDDVLQICRGYMDDLYSRLEAEHDYQTDDDQVWASIEANDLHLADDVDPLHDLETDALPAYDFGAAA